MVVVPVMPPVISAVIIAIIEARIIVMTVGAIAVISISRIVRIAAVIGPVICRSKMLVFLRNVCFLVPRKRELGEPGTEIGLYTSCETAPLPKECSRRLRCSDPAGGRDRLDFGE